MESTPDRQPLSEFERDALCEVASIGAGHAATALSQLADTTVLITVPRVEVVPLAEMPGLLENPEEPMAALYMRVVSEGSGAILVALQRAAALQLVDLMLGRRPGNIHMLSEMEQSALREAGNILAGAFLTAISNFLHLVLLPSVPALAFDMIGALIESLVAESGVDRDYAFVMHIRFEGANCDIRGHFLLVPSSDTLELLVSRLKELAQRGLKG